MPPLKVTPLAFESLGVRSSALSIESDDLKIVIDPAVALAPARFGLPPHPVEEQAKTRLWEKVRENALAADILVVTHYHYDHVEPKEPEIYAGKTVVLKHPFRMINPSQKGRAASFIRSIKKIADEILYADNKSYSFGETTLSFSRPVPHGSDATRGYVVEVCVEAGESFLFTSDVQEPLLDEQLEFIQEKRPGTLFVDGPSTYIRSPGNEAELRRANAYLTGIIREGVVERLVVDHHLARDLDYSERIAPVLEAGEEAGVSVGVAAEFLDVETSLLEARRKELFGKAEI